MGSVKALLPWGDHTLLEAWVERFRQAGCERILVVLGHQSAAIRNAVSPNLPVTWLVNEQAADTGPRESLLLALDQLSEGDCAWFTPVDVPVVAATTLATIERAFVEAAAADTPLAAIPKHGAQTGHPVLAGPDFLERLSEGERGDRIDAIFSWATRRLLHVDVDDLSVLGNMNRPADYRAFAPGIGGPDKEPST